MIECFWMHKLIDASIEPDNHGGDVLTLTFAPPNLAPTRAFHFHVGRGGVAGLRIDPAILPAKCVALPGGTIGNERMYSAPALAPEVVAALRAAQNEIFESTRAEGVFFGGDETVCDQIDALIGPHPLDERPAKSNKQEAAR